MPTINELKEKRFKFLNLLYKKSSGDKFKSFSEKDLGRELGFQEQEIDQISQYLVGENLISIEAYGGIIAITHLGVKEVENALSNPEQSTQYFPPAVNIINIQHMEGSQLQQGTISSNQIGSFQLQNTNNIDKFLKALKEVLPSLNLEEEDTSEINSDITTIEAQLSSSRPKNGFIKECLMSIQRILENTGGAVLAQPFITQIPALLNSFQ